MNITYETALDFDIFGDRAQRSEMLKQTFPELTDIDLKFEPGKENELVLRLATRLNTNQEEIINVMNRGLGNRNLSY